MFKSIILPAVFIASSCLPTAMAETCVAVGWMRDNSVVRLGPQGGSQGVQLFNAKGDQIGEMDCSIDCPGACTDLAAVESEELGDTFFWAGSCNINDFKECHGSFRAQTHIKGEEPTHGENFYGFGISTSAECKIEFEC